MHRKQLLIIILGSLVMTACSTVNVPSPKPSTKPPPSSGQTPPSTSQPSDTGSSPASTLPSSVRALVADAEIASAAGRHEQAAAKLERALRIAPRNAVIWQNLAVVRYRQNRCDEAVNLARRANDLAGSNHGLQADNWRLIATCRKFQGNPAAARKAAAHARELSAQ